MELPKIVERFIKTQQVYDSKAFADCFTETAIVYNEGKTHTGKEEIKVWIEHSMNAYNSKLELLNYEQSESKGILTANVSGTFPGSPIVLKFNFGLKNDLIDSLEVG